LLEYNYSLIGITLASKKNNSSPLIKKKQIASHTLEHVLVVVYVNLEPLL